MSAEIKALEENLTCVYPVKESARNVIENKWVFQRKKNERGKIANYRARLVATDFQQENVLASEYYSPVAKLPSIRMN